MPPALSSTPMSLASSYWKQLGVDSNYASAVELTAVILNIPSISARCSGSHYENFVGSAHLRLTVAIKAQVHGQNFRWRVDRTYADFEVLWSQLLKCGFDVPLLPALFTEGNVEEWLTSLSRWLSESFHGWQSASNEDGVDAKDVAHAFQRFCMHPQSSTPTFRSLLKDLYITMFRSILVRFDGTTSVSKGKSDIQTYSSTHAKVRLGEALTVTDYSRRPRSRSCFIERYTPFKVLCNQYKRIAYYNVKIPASSLLLHRIRSGARLVKNSRARTRGESESSSFSVGAERFRFSKRQGSVDDMSVLSEGVECLSLQSDDGAIYEYEEETEHSSSYYIGRTIQYEQTQSESKESFSPFTITVSFDEMANDYHDKECWSPVSVPPAAPAQVQFHSDSSEYTRKTLKRVAKTLVKQEKNETIHKES